MDSKTADDSNASPPNANPPRSELGSESDCQQIWQAVYQAAESGLRRFLMQKLPQNADVDDCLQSVLVKLLTNATQHTAKVPPPARRAWLFRVASNEANDWWRKQAAKQQTESLDATPNTPGELIALPIESTSTNEQAERARQAIEKLKPEWRTVVRLRLIDEMTFQDIAVRLNIPLGTALTRMRRAMKQLRNELDTDH